MNSSRELIRKEQAEELFWLRNCLNYASLFSLSLPNKLSESVFIVMAEQVIKNVSHRVQSEVWQKTYAVFNFKTLGLTTVFTSPIMLQALLFSFTQGLKINFCMDLSVIPFLRAG